MSSSIRDNVWNLLLYFNCGALRVTVSVFSLEKYLPLNKYLQDRLGAELFADAVQKREKTPLWPNPTTWLRPLITATQTAGSNRCHPLKAATFASLFTRYPTRNVSQPVGFISRTSGEEPIENISDVINY